MKYAMLFVMAMTMFADGASAPDRMRSPTIPGLDEVEYVVIGADTGISSPYPWVVLTTIPSLRFQALYHAGEIGRPGSISEFAWRTAQDLQYGTFNDVTLKMVHTPLTALGPNFADNYHFNEPETVFVAASRQAGTSMAGQWCNIALDTPFEYSDSMNLLVEITWRGATGVSVQLRCPRWSENRWLVATDREAPSGTARPLRHDARIGFAPPGGVETGPVPAGQASLELVPNPVSDGIARLRLQGVAGARARVTVRDVSGRAVLCRLFPVGPATQFVPLDLRPLGAGVYLVRVETDGFSATRKLVVRR